MFFLFISSLVAKQYAGMFREKSMSWTEYHYPETVCNFRIDFSNK